MILFLTFNGKYLMAKNFDLIVIGSGPGGYVAAIRAAQLGFKTAVVERESLGGICLNWGCIPTKALLKSAEVFQYIKNAQDYGIEVENSKADFPKMIKRSRQVANGMSKGIEFLFKKNKITKLMGHGRLHSNTAVEVSQADGSKEIYQARHIIIATGGRAKQLPKIKIDNRHIIEYRKAMSLEKQPKSMIIMGSGAIGVEFAYFYNSIGTKVTIVEYLDRLVPNEDADISKQLETSFKKKGIRILTGSAVESAEIEKGGVSVTVKSKTGSQTLTADILLSAVGIETNLEDLGLELLGVGVENRKIVVDDFYRTNIANIYAIGDIVKGPALAHVASAEGIICVEKLAGLEPEALDYNNIPGCTYCQPEIASVGYTEAEAQAAGYTVKVGKFPFSASGKASAAGKKEGFVKVIYDAKYGEWLGAHFIGDKVTEMVAGAVAARKLETTAEEILKTVHPHPTMSEAIMEATAQAYGEVIHL